MRSILRSVGSQFRDSGLKGVFKKFAFYLKPKRIFVDYLDAVGILDGSRAYKGPGFAQIDLTNNCNNDCIGCWCNSPLLAEKKIDPEVKKQTIPFKRLVALLDELHKMGTKYIYYAGGGEPFMHPEIIEILKYTKRKGFICYINTNFTLVDEKIAGQLADLKIDHLTVSVWAGTPQVYAATHPNKNGETFLRIKEMLKRLNTLKRNSPVIKLYNVIFNMNYHDIEKMVELGLQTNSEAVEFTVIDTIPGKTERLLLNDRERDILLKDCKRLKEKYESREIGNKIRIFGLEQFMRRVSNSGARTAQYDSDMIDKMPCYAGWAFVRILADGNVNSCLKSHRFPVGNILEQDFGVIWNGSLQRQFREKTIRFEKNDPFFSLIGNDPDSNMGCYKSCDNIGHNLDIHGRFNSLSRIEKTFLKGIANLAKSIRNP
ncbi:MAG: radical SAM protein [Candidatus Omnitrophica bacterium]|nr:radical SAM protein [Candidatus Omnitrophota bacterium]MDD5552713.1 radical SAM protein [Candidatus Omnitrophota bacterium]